MFSSSLFRSLPERLPACLLLGFACLLAFGCERDAPPDPMFDDPALKRPNDSKKLTVVFVEGVPVPAESAAEAMEAMRARKPPTQQPSQPPRAASEVRWLVPTKWESVQPSSQVRLAEYRVPPHEAGAAAGEVAVFYLGPAAAVPAAETLQRWMSDFGEDAAKAAKLKGRRVGPYSAHTVEVAGEYQPSAMMGPSGAQPPTKPGWMLLGAIVETERGPYYFKFLGPKEGVEREREAFLTMIDSIGESAGASASARPPSSAPEASSAPAPKGSAVPPASSAP